MASLKELFERRITAIENELCRSGRWLVLIFSSAYLAIQCLPYVIAWHWRKEK